MPPKRVLITGGKGFIGSALVPRLETEYEVEHLPDLADVRRPIDVSAAFEEWEPHIVVHLAGMLGTAELFDAVRDAIDTNINGTVNVLECCKQRGTSFVGVTMPQVFPSVYTATKVAATRLATAYHHAFGLPVSHVTAYNAFGPRQAYGPGHPQKILPTFAVKAWRGEPIPIWGDGTQKVDLIHTAELAEVFRSATHYGDDVYIDGGCGKSGCFTVNEVANFVLDVTDSEGGIEYLPMRHGEVPTEICATGVGWDKLDRPPLFDWEQVAETVIWYKGHPAVTA